MNDPSRRFVESIDPSSHFHVLFAHLPGICFFVKDLHGRFVLANPSFARRVGLEDESQLTGRSDTEVFPADLAEVFQRGDREVIESRVPMRNQVEMFLNAAGLPEWHITNKFPVISRGGEVIGVMGTVQSHEGPLRLHHETRVVEAAETIRERCAQPLSIAELARAAGLSTRQFSRRFGEVFGVSPREFLIKSRIQLACRKLQQPDADLADVAHEVGFYDQSNLGRHFKKHTGITPRQYRQRFRHRDGRRPKDTKK